MSTKESNLTNEVRYLDAFLKYAHPDASSEKINVIYELFHAREIQISSFVENVIAALNPKLIVESVNGRDFNDGSDAKHATVRMGRNDDYYGANISSTHNKNGTLRVIVYEIMQDKFYFFLIPFSYYSQYKDGFNIPFHINTGYPQRHVNSTAKANFWDCEVKTIQDLANHINSPEKIKSNIAIKGSGSREEQYANILSNQTKTTYGNLFEFV